MAYLTKKTYGDKLKDPRWQKKKNKILERDGYTCQNCKSKDKPLAVHHFVYNANGLPWDVDDMDLETLCEDCHFINHYDGFTEMEKDFIELYRMLENRVPGINELVNKKILRIHQNPYSTNLNS